MNRASLKWALHDQSLGGAITVCGFPQFTSTETVGLLGTGAQDGHLDCHTAPELWFPTAAEFPQQLIAVHHAALLGRGEGGVGGI